MCWVCLMCWMLFWAALFGDEDFWLVWCDKWHVSSKFKLFECNLCASSRFFRHCCVKGGAMTSLTTAPSRGHQVGFYCCPELGGVQEVCVFCLWAQGSCCGFAALWVLCVLLLRFSPLQPFAVTLRSGKVRITKCMDFSSFCWFSMIFVFFVVFCWILAETLWEIARNHFVHSSHFFSSLLIWNQPRHSQAASFAKLCFGNSHRLKSWVTDFSRPRWRLFDGGEQNWAVQATGLCYEDLFAGLFLASALIFWCNCSTGELPRYCVQCF